MFLQALIRDVLRAVQVQMQQYSPQELLDLLEAALQLSTPSSLWFQSWEAALQPHLKHLQLQQLMRAAEGVMACGHKPAKPWAGLWFVALQVGTTTGWIVSAVQRVESQPCIQSNSGILTYGVQHVLLLTKLAMSQEFLPLCVLNSMPPFSAVIISSPTIN